MTTAWSWNPWHKPAETAFERHYQELKRLLWEHRDERDTALADDVSPTGGNSQFDAGLAELLIVMGSSMYASAACQADLRLGVLACLSGALIQLGAQGMEDGLAPLDDLFRSLSDLDAGHVDAILSPSRREGKAWRLKEFERGAVEAATLLKLSGLSQKAADDAVYKYLKDAALYLKPTWSRHTLRNLRESAKRQPQDEITNGRYLRQYLATTLLAIPRHSSSVGLSRRTEAERRDQQIARDAAYNRLEAVKNLIKRFDAP